MLEKAGVFIGDESENRCGNLSVYPERIIKNLSQCRQQSKDAVLRMRRAHQMFNDDRGYDVVTLKSGATTKVFTKKEFRIDKRGNVIQQSAASKKGGKGARKKRTASDSRDSASQLHKRQSIRNYFVVQ